MASKLVKEMDNKELLRAYANNAVRVTQVASTVSYVEEVNKVIHQARLTELHNEIVTRMSYGGIVQVIRAININTRNTYSAKEAELKFKMSIIANISEDTLSLIANNRQRELHTMVVKYLKGEIKDESE